MMQQKLIRYITEELHNMDQPSLEAHDDLLESDLLDSMGVMRLVSYIEHEFCIKITPQDLSIENFTNVLAIAALVRSKTEVGTHE